MNRKSIIKTTLSPKRYPKKHIDSLTLDELSHAVRDVRDALEDSDEHSGELTNWQRRQLENVLRRIGIAA